MTTSASILPQPRLVFYNAATGDALSGGYVYTYVPSTTTPKTTWQDSGQVTPNSNPITLDAAGSALIYGAGSYQLTVTDSLGNNIAAYSGLTMDTLGGVATVSTIAALRALATSVPLVWVQGYYNEADGGEGMFVPGVAGRDNGGTIIVSSGGTYYRETGGAPLNAFWFGTQGLADATTELQNALNVGQVLLPGTITIAGNGITAVTGGIVGLGKGVSRIVSTDASAANIIEVIGTIPVQFSGFDYVSSGSKTGGAGIYMNGGGGTYDLADCLFQDLRLSYWYNSIVTNAGSQWDVQTCDFIDHINAGLVVNNVVDSDSGDSEISACEFTSTNTTCAHILYIASGGLRIINNKVNVGGVGINLLFNGSTETGNLLITGNSIENMTEDGIILQRNTACTSVFSRVVITGNQLAVTAGAVSGAGAIVAHDASGFLRDLTITGNVIRVYPTNCVGMDINYVTNFVIDGNALDGPGGSNAATGIGVGSSASGKVGVNTYSGFNTNLSISGANNFYERDVQTGSGTIVCGTSVATGLYQGTLAVTFPVGFSLGPTLGDVAGEVIGGPGIGINVLAQSGTAATFQATSFTNGGSVVFAWKAGGVI